MISTKLKQVILKELHLDEFDLLDSTTADQVPGWDSLRNVAILAAIEKEYGIRFRSLEVIWLKNTGQLQTLIDTKS
jgi:acyl carrier protein